MSLKRFLFAEVYSSEALERDRRESVDRLTRMFEYLIVHPEAVPGLDESGRSAHRAVCDFIAGMTDRYFFRVYESLFGLN
jgi:dGTPase